MNNKRIKKAKITRYLKKMINGIGKFFRGLKISYEKQDLEIRNNINFTLCKYFLYKLSSLSFSLIILNIKEITTIFLSSKIHRFKNCTQ